MITPIYTHQLDTDEPIMLIDKHIGFDAEDGVGIMGDQFQKELLWLDGLGKKRIQVWINSPGGAVMDGMNIYNAILKTKTKVDTYCMGIAASIAGVIFQAGRKRVMADFGQLMYHNPSGGAKDTGLNAIRDSLITMICSRTGKDETEISKMMNRTTWIAADEAMQSGMCDEVESSKDHNKPRQTSSSDAKALWKEASLILVSNNAFKTNTMTKEQLAAIGLSENATAEEITNKLTELTELANKAKAKKAKNGRAIQNDDEETEGTEMKNQLAEIANTMKVIADSNVALKAELDGMKNKVTAGEAATKKVAATELVNKHLDRIGGKTITDDVKNGWIAKAEADLDGTAKLLEALPVNKDKIDIMKTVNELGKGELPTTALGQMAKVKNELKKKGFETYL